MKKNPIILLFLGFAIAVCLAALPTTINNSQFGTQGPLYITNAVPLTNLLGKASSGETILKIGDTNTQSYFSNSPMRSVSFNFTNINATTPATFVILYEAGGTLISTNIAGNASYHFTTNLAQQTFTFGVGPGTTNVFLASTNVVVLGDDENSPYVQTSQSGTNTWVSLYNPVISGNQRNNNNININGLRSIFIGDTFIPSWGSNYSLGIQLDGDKGEPNVVDTVFSSVKGITSGYVELITGNSNYAGYSFGGAVFNAQNDSHQANWNFDAIATSSNAFPIIAGSAEGVRTMVLKGLPPFTGLDGSLEEPYMFNCQQYYRTIMALQCLRTNMLVFGVTNGGGSITLLDTNGVSSSTFYSQDGVLYPTYSSGGTITTTNVLYVAKNGDDVTAIRGRLDKPWASIQVAGSNALSGDTVMVFPGTYTDSIPTLLTNSVNFVFLGAGLYTYTGMSMAMFHDDLGTDCRSTNYISAPGWTFYAPNNSVFNLYQPTNLYHIEIDKVIAGTGEACTFGHTGTYVQKNWIKINSVIGELGIHLEGGYWYLDIGRCEGTVSDAFVLQGGYLYINCDKTVSTGGYGIDQSAAAYYGTVDFTGDIIESDTGAMSINGGNNTTNTFRVATVKSTGYICVEAYLGKSTFIGCNFISTVDDALDIETASPTTFIGCTIQSGSGQLDITGDNNASILVGTSYRPEKTGPTVIRGDNNFPNSITNVSGAIYGNGNGLTNVVDKELAKTANYTVLTTDTGVWFDNAGASGAVTNTLPAAAANLEYGFIISAAQQFAIKPNGTDTIRLGATAGSAGGIVVTNVVGTTLRLRAVGTQWIAVSQQLAWTVQ